MPELGQIEGRFAESICFVVLVWFCCEGAVNLVALKIGFLIALNLPGSEA
jgi:hypothetical protein